MLVPNAESMHELSCRDLSSSQHPGLGDACLSPCVNLSVYQSGPCIHVTYVHPMVYGAEAHPIERPHLISQPHGRPPASQSAAAAGVAGREASPYSSRRNRRPLIQLLPQTRPQSPSSGSLRFALSAAFTATHTAAFVSDHEQ